MKKHLNHSSFVISPVKINILNFEKEMRNILRRVGQDIWFSDGAIDILVRTTIDNPFVEVKANKTLFKHQIQTKTLVPFMTYVPTTGIDESQIFCLSSNKRKYTRDHIGKFMCFFKQYHDREDIFPKDATFLISPYVRRYYKKEITSICAYFETSDNIWNFYERSYPLEFKSGSIYFSEAQNIPTNRKESLREFVLRKTIDKKEFS